MKCTSNENLERTFMIKHISTSKKIYWCIIKTQFCEISFNSSYKLFICKLRTVCFVYSYLEKNILRVNIFISLLSTWAPKNSRQFIHIGNLLLYVFCIRKWLFWNEFYEHLCCILKRVTITFLWMTDRVLEKSKLILYYPQHTF